jgi:hypothetical protein
MDDISEETSLLSESDFGVISFQRPSFSALTSFSDAAGQEIDGHLRVCHWGAPGDPVPRYQRTGEMTPLDSRTGDSR